MSKKIDKKQTQIIKRVLQELKPYRFHLIASLICAAFTVVFTLMIPVYIG